MKLISSDQLKDSLRAASQQARWWFERHALHYTANEFHSRGQLDDSGRGAVYVYFDVKSSALYVGLTKRRVKARLYDQTSPHKEKPWFKDMTSMKFIQLENDMDRQILEFLLILAYGPLHNEKPRAVSPDELFLGFP
jgi:hypothetical protein